MKEEFYIKKAASLIDEHCKPLLSMLNKDIVSIVRGYIVDPNIIKPESLLLKQQDISNPVVLEDASVQTAIIGDFDDA